MQFRLFIMLFVLLFGNYALYAQSEKKNKIDNTHFLSFAPSIQTNGFGINVKWGHSSNQSSFLFYNLDFGKIKHAKEFRFLGDGRYNGFVYGRKNIALPLNLGIGKYYILGVRNSKNDIGVACAYQAGLSLALLKPVYLFVNERPGSVNSQEILMKYNGEASINLDNIVGGAPFFTGINQLSVIPGCFIKASLLFSWGKYYSDYHVLETGFLLETYSKELPLMARTTNSFIYPSFFINFNIGKFW